MKVEFSDRFAKDIKKLSGKMLVSVLSALDDVRRAQRIEDLANCRKLVGYRHIYRIRIGDKRAFFSFHVELLDGRAYFIHLANRGSAYDKRSEQVLKREDI